MKAEEFERREKLRLMADDRDGVTQVSLDNVETFLKLIRPPYRMFLIYQQEEDSEQSMGSWEFLTYVIDRDGRAVRFSGFSWGYGGEGPRGLVSLIEKLGWVKPCWSSMPSAHEPGIWVVERYGMVERWTEEHFGTAWI